MRGQGPVREAGVQPKTCLRAGRLATGSQPSPDCLPRINYYATLQAHSLSLSHEGSSSKSYPYQQLPFDKCRTIDELVAQQVAKVPYRSLSDRASGSPIPSSWAAQWRLLATIPMPLPHLRPETPQHRSNWWCCGGCTAL